MKGSIAAALLLAGLVSAPAAKAAEAPPGFSLAKTGGVHDFDYLEGAWTTIQHKLKKRHVGSTEWEDFPAVMCLTRYMDGTATVDELYMPAKKSAGLTLQLFDPGKRQWSIYWVDSAIGQIDPVPTVGGFEGPRGEFYALDEDDGQPVKVRYLWLLIDHDHTRWEQAFSYDDRTWETNWTADFTRADPAEACEHGRPKR